MNCLIALGALILSIGVASSPTEAQAVEKAIQPKPGFFNLLFDFDLYRQKFNKHYDSSLETSRRLKIFIAKSYLAFKSYLRYSVGACLSYSAVNQFSDWTPEEARNYFAAENVPDDLIGLTDNSIEEHDEALAAGFLELVRGELVKAKEKFDQSLSKVFSVMTDGESSLKLNPHPDLRQSNCFVEPKNQKDCGSCYAFVTVAMFEHLYCLKMNKTLSFSEQFMVDCGYAFGLGGCQGGRATSSIKMIQEIGLELSSNSPYMGRQERCAYQSKYSPRLDVVSAGKIRIRGSVDGLMFQEQHFERVLSMGRPIYVAIRLYEEPFLRYGGGIDVPPEIESSSVAHAMLLVGSGLEAGTEYWILRNSHGVEWGEGGYYRLVKREGSKYFVGKRGYALLAPLNKFEFVENKDYSPHGELDRHKSSTKKTMFNRSG